jgi:hypothetical protein
MPVMQVVRVPVARVIVVVAVVVLVNSVTNF